MTYVNHPRVYDLLHPSPPSLKNIVAVSIAVELWRKEISKYRAMNALNGLNLRKKISLDKDSPTPEIPSTLLKLIEKYTGKIGPSIQHWLEYNYRWTFKFDHNDHNHILADFDDFVGDIDGEIDDEKTARRAVLCDRFSDFEKFLIASKYCFEEDAVKLWPSVSSLINIDDFDDNLYPSLHYWFNHFKFETIDADNYWRAHVLRSINITGPTLEYFWNRIDSASRVKVAIKRFDVGVLIFSPHTFCRHVLSKLNDQEFDQFMLARGDDVLSALIENQFCKVPLVLPTWRIVRNKITKKGFISIVRKILEKQTNYCSRLNPDTSNCCEIWRTAPYKLRRAAISDILSDSSLFVPNRGFSAKRQSEFLLTLLSDATIEERNSFWTKNWPSLILGTNGKDLRDLINLCIEDQNKIDEFKKTELSNYEVIGPCCSELLMRADFQKLNDFINFCCPEEEIKKKIKSRLLYEEFELKVTHIVILKPKLFDDFIKSTFDEDEASEFKNDLSWTLADNEDLSLAVIWGHYRQVMEFVDTIVSSEEVARDLKEGHFPDVISSYFSGVRPSIYDFAGDEVSKFLWWCFEDDEKIKQFKQNLPIEKIVRWEADEMMKNINDPHKRKCRNFDLDAFMEWYFTSSESLAEFKTSLADVFEKIGHT